jgi:hypothetical protein
MSKEIIIALLTGGVLVSIINGAIQLIMWRKNRKAQKEDKAEQDVDKRLKAIESTMAVIVQSQKYMLYDRIRFLGQSYIKDGEVDFDDRRILTDMHNTYHNGLGGNGDLDNLMKEVNALPLKLK